MIVRKLKPWVTTFSAAIPSKHQHGDDICVGGTIVSILDLSDLLPVDSEKREAVYMTLDDGVGVINLVIPKEVYEAYKKELGLDVGTIVLAYGRLHSLPLQKDGKPIKNHPEETIRLLCWKFSVLPEEEQRDA